MNTFYLSSNTKVINQNFEDSTLENAKNILTRDIKQVLTESYEENQIVLRKNPDLLIKEDDFQIVQFSEKK